MIWLGSIWPGFFSHIPRGLRRLQLSSPKPTPRGSAVRPVSAPVGEQFPHLSGDELRLARTRTEALPRLAQSAAPRATGPGQELILACGLFVSGIRCLRGPLGRNNAALIADPRWPIGFSKPKAGGISAGRARFRARSTGVGARGRDCTTAKCGIPVAVTSVVRRTTRSPTGPASLPPGCPAGPTSRRSTARQSRNRSAGFVRRPG